MVAISNNVVLVILDDYQPRNQLEIQRPKIHGLL